MTAARSRLLHACLFVLALTTILRPQAVPPDDMRQLIRKVVREELAETKPENDALRRLIREEIRLAVRDELKSPDGDELREQVRVLLAEAQIDRALEKQIQEAFVRLEDRGRKGPFLADGFLRIRTTGLLQFRYGFNHRKDVSGREDDIHAFDLPRIRLQVDGNLTDELTFTVRGGFTGLQRRRTGFEDRDGELTVEIARARYRLENGFTLSLGQFGLALYREDMIGSAQTLGADYSVVDGTFAQGKSRAIELSRADETLRWWAALSSGLQTPNVGFSSVENADFALTFRAETVLGHPGWARFDDFASWPESQLSALLGLAVHFEKGARTASDEPAFHLFYATADVSVEGDGWSTFAAFIWAHTDVLAPDTGDDLGFVVQAAAFVQDPVEIFGRFEGILASTNRDLGDFYSVTVGFNWYLVPHSHSERITVELLWFLDETDDAFVFPSENIGVLSSAFDDQWALRAQYQIIF